MDVSTKNKGKEDKENKEDKEDKEYKENCPLIPVIDLIEAERFIADIDWYPESINMSRVQWNSLPPYGRKLREQNMRQITAQPTLFWFFGTPKATSKETEKEKTSSVVWYSSSRVGGRNK